MNLRHLLASLAVGVTLAGTNLFAARAAQTEVAVGFSPALPGQLSALKIVLATIDSATQSLDVAAYSFTSKPIALALVAAQRRGVRVRIVVDAKSSGGRYSAATFVANRGVPVRTNDHFAIQHNKFMVVDGMTVQTGSFNYTGAAAERNAENALVVRGDPTLATRYRAAWESLWEGGRPLSAP